MRRGRRFVQTKWAIVVAIILSSLLYSVIEFYPLRRVNSSLAINDPVLNLNNGDEASIMANLLDQNREEIRFWQDKLFSISLTFAAVVIGTVAYVFEKESLASHTRFVFAAGLVFFCCFYLVFVRFVNNAIVVNDYDNIRIQYALELCTPGKYLKEQSIYTVTDPAKELPEHEHIRALVQFNGLLVILSANLIVFLRPTLTRRPT